VLKAFICGLAGHDLLAGEAHFLAAEKPCGIILFARNCASYAQIRRLVADARSAVGSDQVLVLIDQEGGRVQRLRPPLGRALPPAAAYGEVYAADPARALALTRDVAQLLAEDLREFGIDTDCAPVLDLPVPGAHGIIGDRAFADTPEPVIALAGAFAEGLMRGGVLPVIKHIPGHGRATKDSHLDLPIVTTPADELSRTDFATFKALAHLPAAMTAHVIFTAFDPDRPASVSKAVHDRVIRGEIGYDGLMMSDDLNMQALSGSLGARAGAVLEAGSDVALHCNGNLAEMSEIAASAPWLDGKALVRFEQARSVTCKAGSLTPSERDAMAASLNDLLANRGNRSESV
jgi:beta-N-acetylhexosaminidase